MRMRYSAIGLTPLGCVTTRSYYWLAPPNSDRVIGLGLLGIHLHLYLQSWLQYTTMNSSRLIAVSSAAAGTSMRRGVVDVMTLL
jgi:hypothetical protein